VNARRGTTGAATAADWHRYAGDWAASHGGYDPRRAPSLVRGWLWLAYALGRLLGPAGITPTAVTVIGLALSAGVPATAPRGHAWPLAAAGLVALAALADTVDGALAVVTGRTSRLGHVYDSVADRLGEACWLIALWLLGTPGWLAVLCGGLTWLHEYLRARAAVAGMSGIGAVTLGERPTRVLVVLFGLALSGLAGLAGPDLTAGTATIAAAVWAVLGAVGLVQLFGAVRQALGRGGVG
jgi:phosphatidylglycerophosphate synthase